ncbi:hypothetical protein [Flavobacterium sp.]|uniref:hypothetical protein n=1 Tax=Flavobacterium sp. TaxID=239 RepID=UPI003F6961D0
MKKIINKTVKLDLIGIDGNAHAILGVFRRQALREGWTMDEVEQVLNEAKSSNYDHLLAAILNHCEVEDEPFIDEDYED